MPQLDAISATRSVKQRLLDFCRSDHYITDPEIDRIFRSIWDSEPGNGGLAGDLWVEAAFPPRGCGQKMVDFVKKGLVTRELADRLDANGAFRLDWELREIQSESVRLAREADEMESKPAIVVSAGTGAGKTESFLLPMLDELLRNPRKAHAGTSAIILYPMNALVMDQVERLTNWLQGQTALKIFHFTGETPENHKRANDMGYPKLADCCFRTRQQARGLEDESGRIIPENERADQPDVIVTNYSMLEYMLCRPQDAVFFGKNLRHLVLDEVHLYTGNLAAEITMLLRRVAIKCGVENSKINHYATSATLVEGEEEQKKGALQRFAAKVFSKPNEAVSVVLGREAEARVPAPTSREAIGCPESQGDWPPLSSIAEVGRKDQLIISSDDDWREWMDSLEILLPDLDSTWEKPKEICRFLHRKLPEIPVFQHLYHLLYENRIQPLNELAKALYGTSHEPAREATRRLLQAGAIARADVSENPLLPNRIHWSVRSPSGLFFSFAHEHAPNDEQIYRIDEVPVGYFYSPGYHSRPEDDETHPLLVMRDTNRGEWLLAGVEQGERLVVGQEALPKTPEQLATLLGQLSFFRLDLLGELKGTLLEFDPITGLVGDPGGVSLRKLDYTEQEKKSIKPMGNDSRLQVSLVAEGALAEMPPYPGGSKDWKPAKGRRLLVFSDSRSEAARLGANLTGNHERQLFRALVVKGLGKIGEDVSGEIEKKIDELEKSKAGLPDVARAAIQQEIDNLVEEREVAHRGLFPGQFVEKLKSCNLVEEFFDRQKGEQHAVSKWSQKVFDLNRSAIQNSLSQRLSQEMARKTLWPDLDLETAGLLELAYPGIEELHLNGSILGQLPREDVREKIENSYSDFLGMMLDHVRDQGGITLGDEVSDLEFGHGGGYIGRWISLEDRFKRLLQPLLTTSDDTMIGNFSRLYLQQAGMSEEEAGQHWKVFIGAIFEQLYEDVRAGRIDWLEFGQRQAEENHSVPALRLIFSKLRIRRPLNLYQCSDSGQIWPRNALGCHMRSARPSLERIEPEQLADNPRIARVHKEWTDSAVFRQGLWAEEHSAQIGPTENRRLQDLFKAGIRNVLSSTTTLELGIDIGGLNGVMMGNIPPGKASYLQRAGRAGRRADGSSLVISYSRNRPYERKVFENFGDYLGSPLREPVVFLDRIDIIRRHIHAILIGDFFSQAYGHGATRGAMDAFGRMGTFTNMLKAAYWRPEDIKPEPRPDNAQSDLDPGFAWGAKGSSLADFFDSYLESNAKSLGKRLAESMEEVAGGTGLEAGTEEHRTELILSLREKVRQTIQAWRRDYDRLFQQWAMIPSNADRTHRNLANALHYQLKQLYGMTLIESLSDAMILPRYGFPIGLSELKVIKGNQKKSDLEGMDLSEAYKLNRSASQSINEYAPGSKILAGARIIHSQGILKSWTGDDIPSEGMGLRAWYRWNEGTGNFKYQYDRFKKEDEGHQQEAYTRQGELLFVKHGFTSAAWEKPTYGGSPKRIGSTLTICNPPEGDMGTSTPFPDFFGVPETKATLHVGGELLAMNSGEHDYGFAVCIKCGFAKSEVRSCEGGAITGRQSLPRGFDWHAPIHDMNEWKNCWDREETLVMRHLHLAARQVCDFLEIDLPEVSATIERRTLANTLGQALRLSGTQMLKVDPRELSLLRPPKEQRTRISICDSLAGGAGHVRDLSEAAEEWWTNAVDMIRNGSPTQAMLSLLTADVPSKKGLPDLDIEGTRNFLDQLENGVTQEDPEIGARSADVSDPDEDLDFSAHLKA